MEGYELAGRFLLRRLVGQGGFGAVFEAEQMSMGRRCAVKVLLPGRCGDQATASRFKAEARATSRLSHANSVVIYDYGQLDEQGLLFMAMEYIEGQDMNRQLAQDGPFDLATAVLIARQIAGSLQEAHDQGLVHRDIKPHNVMLLERSGERHFVKVIDFGIAKAMQSSRMTLHELTLTGTMIGTPHYMSPEQILDKDLDGRADQYALAITIYKMLTGRTPFMASTAIEIASMQLGDEARPVSTFRMGMGVSRGFDAVLLKALSKAPERRFETVVEFADALTAAAAPSSVILVGGEAAHDETAQPAVGLEASTQSYSGSTLVELQQTLSAQVFLPDLGANSARTPFSPTRAHGGLLGGIVALCLMIAALASNLLAQASGVEAPSAIAPAPKPVVLAAVVALDPQGFDPVAQSHSVTQASLHAWRAFSASEQASAQAIAQTSAQAIARPPASAATPAQAALKPGRVRVTLIPWGTLYVNHRSYADLARQELQLAPGRYTFVLKQLEDEKASKIVDVKAGSLTIVELVAR